MKTLLLAGLVVVAILLGAFSLGACERCVFEPFPLAVDCEPDYNSYRDACYVENGLCRFRACCEPGIGGSCKPIWI